MRTEKPSSRLAAVFIIGFNKISYPTTRLVQHRVLDNVISTYTNYIKSRTKINILLSLKYTKTRESQKFNQKRKTLLVLFLV